MGEPKITVIIPTYNRAPILDRTLRALCEDQRGELPAWEVIVVNDGSNDETAVLLDDARRRYPGRLTAMHQDNMRQGAARNRAMARARGELFVFLGDDIIPEPGFLGCHWQGYLKWGMSPSYAAIGRTRWHPDIKATPFRDWINEWGLQFGFRVIRNRDNLPFNFFYTSNLGFSRDLYDGLGGFAEQFQEYGWEDIELGYRYQGRGRMRLHYLPEALASHHHHISVRSFCRRQFKVGYSAVCFCDMYPELREFLKITDVSPRLTRLRPALGLAALAIEFCDERLGINLNDYTGRILHRYYLLGMLQAQQEHINRLRPPTLAKQKRS